MLGMWNERPNSTPKDFPLVPSTASDSRDHPPTHIILYISTAFSKAEPKATRSVALSPSVNCNRICKNSPFSYLDGFFLLGANQAATDCEMANESLC